MHVSPNVIHRRARRNQIVATDALVIPADRAARMIAARYGLSIHHAAVVARLAGLGMEARS